MTILRPHLTSRVLATMSLAAWPPGIGTAAKTKTRHRPRGHGPSRSTRKDRIDTAVREDGAVR
jgi:hypothetical protein